MNSDDKIIIKYEKLLAKRLEELRIEKGLSKNQLHILSGIAKGTVADHLNGKSNTITFKSIIKYCNAYGISLIELFNFEYFK